VARLREWDVPSLKVFLRELTPEQLRDIVARVEADVENGADETTPGALFYRLALRARTAGNEDGA